MKINIQLFGGRGASSGGNYRGATKPPRTHNSNAVYYYYKNGKLYQKRWYDDKGNPKRDKDYTDHGNSKKHPVTPHYHDYDSSGKHGNGYWIDEYGVKHYFKD